MKKVAGYLTSPDILDLGWEAKLVDFCSRDYSYPLEAKCMVGLDLVHVWWIFEKMSIKYNQKVWWVQLLYRLLNCVI